MLAFVPVSWHLRPEAVCVCVCEFGVGVRGEAGRGRGRERERAERRVGAPRAYVAAGVPIPRPARLGGARVEALMLPHPRKLYKQ